MTCVSLSDVRLWQEPLRRYERCRRVALIVCAWSLDTTRRAVFGPLARFLLVRFSANQLQRFVELSLNLGDLLLETLAKLQGTRYAGEWARRATRSRYYYGSEVEHTAQNALLDLETLHFA
jgi:hypothetical protein